MKLPVSAWGRPRGETLVTCEPVLLDLVDVERQVGHDEVN